MGILVEVRDPGELRKGGGGVVKCNATHAPKKCVQGTRRQVTQAHAHVMLLFLCVCFRAGLRAAASFFVCVLERTHACHACARVSVRIPKNRKVPHSGPFGIELLLPWETESNRTTRGQRPPGMQCARQSDALPTHRGREPRRKKRCLVWCARVVESVFVVIHKKL